MSIFCDGINRRDFIRIGGLAGVGMSLAQYLQIAEAGEVRPAKAKAAIFIRLSGGPSHLDTFDMKPSAPDTHRGEFREISTKIPGIRFCEHLPKLAQCSDKFAILRGVSHSLADHRLGTKYMTTGNRPLPSLEYPGYGAVISRELPGPADLPNFVAVPGGDETTGFLGVEYGPLNTGQTPKPGKKLEIRGLSLNGGVTLADLDRRQDLLKRFDHAFDSLAKDDKILAGLDRFTQRAFSMIRSPKVRAAFDLSQESAAITRHFNETPFAQSCLLATRLVETGVRFVTVSFGGWDTHDQNFTRLKDQLLPPLGLGPLRAVPCLGAEGTLGLDDGLRHRRVRPHTQDQRPRRARSLSSGHVLPHGRRRHSRRAGRRRLRRPRRSARARPLLARRRGGHVLQDAGHRHHEGIPHAQRAAGDDCAQRQGHR